MYYLRFLYKNLAKNSYDKGVILTNRAYLPVFPFSRGLCQFGFLKGFCSLNVKWNTQFARNLTVQSVVENKAVKTVANFCPDDNLEKESPTTISEGNMIVLNVAEKNDAAKRIAGLLSQGTSVTRNGLSVYNKIYEFKYQIFNQNCTMKMTSVAGHLLTHEFTAAHKKWYSCDPVALFDAPVIKICPSNYEAIKKTLEGQAPYCHVLIIWTDCDREGENIAFEIIDVCKAINPRLRVYRAKFSEITPTAVTRAINNLGQPDKRTSDAVEVRSELDLRIGAAFTRFQTLRLTKMFSSLLADHLISYGSCQFPTLGFVVERYKSIQSFIPEDFWKIEVSHNLDGCTVDFQWARVRLFVKLPVQIIYEKCLDNPMAKVVRVESKPKSKWRPVALDTVEFEKLSSRKLKIGAKEAMKIAEKLYTSGLISYPRTETNIFPPGLDLPPLVEQQTASNQWGGFATRLLQQGTNPRNGKKSDQAHPPIHPTKFTDSLTGNEARVYELVVRHFLACCSKDALGKETTVEIEIAEERFFTHGLIILERNYLEVYVYDKWSDKELPNFTQGQTFRPTKIEMNEGQTSAPNLLTEADLIALMEKHGIGTDATHAEHIETIKSRMYVGVQDGKFVPGQLGMGLVEGYDSMGFEMSKPRLRAGLEMDLKRICEGTRQPQDVLREQIAKYKEVFIQAVNQVNKLDEAIGTFLNANPSNPNSTGRPGGAGGNFRRNPGNGGDDDNDDDGFGPGGGNSYSTGTNHSTSNHPQTGSIRRSGKTCVCGQEAEVRTVRKEGPNQGRLFCKCDICGFFDWMDEAPSVNESGYGSSIRSTQNAQMPPPPPRAQSYVNFSNSRIQPTQTVTINRPPVRNIPSQSQRPVQPPVYNSRPNADLNNVDPQLPNCNCQTPASSYTVKKEGPNKGRLFFGCSKPMGAPDKCSFFQWDDEGIGAQTQGFPNATSFGSSRGGRGRGRGYNPSGDFDVGGGYMAAFENVGRATSRTNRGGNVGGRRPRRCGNCHQEGHTRTTCPESPDDGDGGMDY